MLWQVVNSSFAYSPFVIRLNPSVLMSWDTDCPELVYLRNTMTSIGLVIKAAIIPENIDERIT